MKKLVALIAVAIAIAAFFIFDLGQYLSLEYIQSKLSGFQTFTNNNIVLAIAIFMLVYIVMAALSVKASKRMEAFIYSQFV